MADTSSTTVSTITPGAAAGGETLLGTNSGLSGVAGITPSTAVITNEQLTSDLGKEANYTIAVQVPIPFLNLNLKLNLVGDFVLPLLTAVGVPKAITFLISNAQKLFQPIIEDAMDLLRAIPWMTITIQIKVGPAVVYSIILVMEPVPIVITPPNFALGLPNFAADAAFALALTGKSPSIVLIPRPVPIFNPVPLLGITGGQVSAGATTNVIPGASQTGGAVAAGAGMTPGGGAGSAGSVAYPKPFPSIATINPISKPLI